MAKLNTGQLLHELDLRWGGKLCPYCGGKWIVTDKIFELREYHNGNLVLGGGVPIQPVVTITCENCGNTVLVNPLVLKAVEE